MSESASAMLAAALQSLTHPPAEAVLHLLVYRSWTQVCAGLKRKANHSVEEGNDMVPGGDFKVQQTSTLATHSCHFSAGLCIMHSLHCSRDHQYHSQWTQKCQSQTQFCVLWLAH